MLSHTTMLTISRRPGPLRELPLEQFSHESITQTRNKRPLSPGVPNPFSPAKRRILAEEGVFSPEKTMKSPLSSSAACGRFAPSHFQDLLSGPDSPARKLDFGKSSSQSRNATPSTSQLFAGFSPDVVTLTCPRLASASGSQSQDGLESMNSVFEDPTEDYFFTSSSTDSAKLMISCTSSLPYEQSTHYPGFEIWRDPCDGDSPPVSASPGIPPSPSSSEANLQDDEDKENSAPRKKSRKTVICSELPVKRALWSPVRKSREVEERSGKSKSVLVTPRISQSRSGPAVSARRFTDLELTPGRPTSVDQDELRRRREMLSLEVDGDGEGDDDEEEEA